MIDTIIGIEIPEKTITEILTNLGFTVKVVDSIFSVEVFTSRINDIQIPEDIVEEVARVYGYSKIPNILPPSPHLDYYHQDKSEFYWITKMKNAFKFWGFNEVYTYSLVSESLFDGPIEHAVKLKNPLDSDHEYLRNSLIPGLMSVASENERVEKLQIFELSNVYLKQQKGLPEEVLHLAGLIRHQNSTFYEAKGVVEQVLAILGVTQYSFEEKKDGIEGAYIVIGKSRAGSIETDENNVSFEIDMSLLLAQAKSQKKYIPIAKFPPIIEDVRVELSGDVAYEQIVDAIKKVSSLVSDVSLLDQYKNKKTFRITFLDRQKNLTNEEIAPVRERIYKALEKTFNAHIG
jgi:phenylalanyl-tRNA synthetase beta chain